MIRRVVALSIRRPRLVLAGVIVLVALGVAAMRSTPVDAIPDLGEGQVVVFAEWQGRGAREVEDQVTHPLASTLGGLAGVKTVRASSEPGLAMLHAILADDADAYAVRARVAERLAAARPLLPRGVAPGLAPDATSLGQILWYTVEGGGKDLGELRAIQDFQVRDALRSVPGVAEIASAGGFVREYQVDVDPLRLAALGLTLADVTSAVARANASIGGQAIERDGSETRVRGVGWVRDTGDLESAVVATRGGAPILVRHVATVHLGPAPRRSILEKDGGEAVGGVVVMRQGEDPSATALRVRERIDAIAPGLPAGVRIVPFYDRTRLVRGAIGTLRSALIEEILVASLAVVLILSHFRAALLVCATVPLAILFAFLCMRVLGVASNVMSLAGIAISIGVLVDAAIVITENAHHRLRERFGDAPVAGDVEPTVLAACRIVGGPLFFALLITALPFLPVLALTGTEGRMFHPLAYTKLFALAGVALLAITFVPALIPRLVRGRLRAADDNWAVRSVVEIYRPALAFCLRSPDLLLVATGALLVVPIGLLPPRPPYSELAVALPFAAVIPIALLARRKLACSAIVLAAGLFASGALEPLGEEFMPALDEGTILDMPVTAPGVSADAARDHLLRRDALLRTFPEVAVVVGKAGRADTATDPSPLEMVESIVDLHPKALWPRRRLAAGCARRCAERVREALGRREPIDDATVATASEDFDDFARAWSRARLGGAPSEDAVAAADRELLELAPARLAAIVVARIGATDAAGVDELAPLLAHDVVLEHVDAAGLRAELDRVVRMPGYGNIWTQPIVNRAEMLATGVRSQVGVKLFGDDGVSTASTLARLDELAARVAAALRTVPGAADVFPDLTSGRAALDVAIDRERAARFGVAAADVDAAIAAATGGEVVATAIAGRRSLPIRVRFARDSAEDEESLRRLPVAGASSGDSPPIPLGEVAAVTRASEPGSIKSEDGSLVAYVQASVHGRDVVDFVADARAAVAREVALPDGFHVEWSGRYEEQVRASRTLRLVLPVVLLLVLGLLWLAYRDLAAAGIMALAVPGALAGGLVFQRLFEVPFSVAVWVGYISCFGMATATAIVMLVYLREAIERRGGLDAIGGEAELRAAVMEGAVQRVRPKLLTELTMILGLVPLLWASGPGGEVLRPMAVPILGGILVADEVIDLLVPVLYCALARRRLRIASAPRSSDAVAP